MSFLYKNWFVHNMFAHPLHELVYLALRLLMFGKTRARRVSNYIHDVTVPRDSDFKKSLPGVGSVRHVTGSVPEYDKMISDAQKDIATHGSKEIDGVTYEWRSSGAHIDYQAPNA